MVSPLRSIIRRATRQDNEPLNIVCFISHEPYELQLSKTDHNFYAWSEGQIRQWNYECRQPPDNYIVLNRELSPNQLPDYIDPDLIIVHNKLVQMPIAKRLSGEFHIPIINVEHTLPPPGWGENEINQVKKVRGHTNVFISEYNRDMWGWAEDECDVIYHGIDINIFCLDNKVGKSPFILSVVNDFINRDWACGFNLWRQVTAGLPVKPIGNTPGLSMGTKSLDELIHEYRSNQVFINTSLVSPVPMSLMEAMSCGCAIVSTATCSIPEIIEHGESGLLSNDPAMLRKYVEKLLGDADLRKKLGAAARQAIIERFNENTFVDKWRSVIQRTVDTYV